jgi:DsbC/DsbD-like thiol-disulfide interchange protein
MIRQHLLPAFAILLSFATARPADAGGLRPSDIVAGNLRAGWQTDGGAQIVALHLKLAHDWITYWRHPGESGIAPQIDWSGSENVAALRAHWPEPRLFMKAGFNSIGYADEVIIPLELTPKDPSAPIALHAVLTMGVCNDVCVPVDLIFAGTATGPGKPDRAIASVLERKPRPARANGLREVACSLQPTKRGAMLQVALDIPVTGQSEFMLLELPDTPTRAMPSERVGGQLVGQTFLRARDGRVPAVDRSTLGITVISENGALYHLGCAP